MLKLILLFFIHFLYGALADPIVTTNYGKLQGFSLDLENDVVADVFLRVPFAEPPVKNLRLEKPQPPKKYNDVRNSTYFGPACIQHSRKSPIQDTDEDCLHLNIIAPHKKTPEGYPVFFWIHASGWEILSSITHGYKGIAERFAPQGVIVVTTNYRLGALGFMTDGTKNFAGNLGLWDQAAALKFVSENIKAFGGDPNRITVAGGSAGGSSASILSLSPHSRDLFHQTISMSGSLYTFTAICDRVIDVSEKLAQELHCHDKDSDKIKECMRRKTIDDIQDAVEKLGTSRYELNTHLYAPRIDGDFFTDEYEELIKEAPKKPTMVGFDQDEGSVLTVSPDNTVINGLIIKQEDQEKYSREDLVKFIKEIAAPEKIFANQAKEVQDKLIDFYVNRDVPENTDYKFWLQRYTDIISDVHFNVPSINDAIAKVEQNWPVYLYFTEYFNENMLPKGFTVRGSPHLAEYPFLFGFSFYQPFDMNEDDLKAQKIWMEVISNFVKTGNPSTKDVKWTQLLKDKLNYMNMSLDPKMDEGLKLENVHLWNQLASKYAYDMIRGVKKENLLSKNEL